MEIRVLGCYGSHLPGHGTTSFLLDETILIDGGTITSVLSIEEQMKVGYVLLTHAHLDHIRDIMFLVDNIFYLQRKTPLVLVGSAGILETVHRHLFNGCVWPDFFTIPSRAAPILKMAPIKAGEYLQVGSLRIQAVPVHHTVETLAYTIASESDAVVFIGDTGPTDAVWDAANMLDYLRAVFIETSFPNRLSELARLTRHLTPFALAREIDKLTHQDAMIYAYHVKLHHDEEIEEELQALRQAGRIRLLHDGMRINVSPAGSGIISA